MVRRREARDELLDVGLVLGDEPALELALVALAERVEPCAAQKFQPRHHTERRHRPRPGLALAHDARLRVGPGEGQAPIWK